MATADSLQLGSLQDRGTIESHYGAQAPILQEVDFVVSLFVLSFDIDLNGKNFEEEER